jgi:hypothetical protein
MLTVAGTTWTVAIELIGYVIERAPQRLNNISRNQRYIGRHRFDGVHSINDSTGLYIRFTGELIWYSVEERLYCVP